jgi:phage recombination protein Bet
VSNALAAYNAAAPIRPAEFAISNEQIDLIKRTIMPNASDIELQLFVNLCRAKRLDPLTRQIYAIKPERSGWQFFASIDGLRIIAERSGKYLGQTAPLWCGPDGAWRDVWLEEGPPAAAKIGVYKAGATEPTWGVARWQSYGANKRSNWLTMPDVMLAKCAEALALRKAFPDDLSGLYVREEMDRDQAPQPARSEMIDRETGEITAPLLSLDDDIKRLRGLLGWSAQDVIDEARRMRPIANLKTRGGKQAMADHLQEYVDALNSEHDGPAQDSFIDAESHVAGEPGLDRHSA